MTRFSEEKVRLLTARSDPAITRKVPQVTPAGKLKRSQEWPAHHRVSVYHHMATTRDGEGRFLRGSGRSDSSRERGGVYAEMLEGNWRGMNLEPALTVNRNLHIAEGVIRVRAEKNGRQPVDRVSEQASHDCHLTTMKSLIHEG